MKRQSYFLAFLFVALPFALQCQTKQIKNLDAFLEKAMIDWEVPGMEVLIVKDGEVLLEKGYGVRNTETNEPVTENTLMAIASNTKAFTTASLSMLVDEGKINWTDKVVDYLPYFKMYDPYVTQEFTIEDLVTHRSGLATFSGDLLWYGTTHSRVEVIKRAQFLKPVRGFREGYGYQNIMFTAAGEVIAAVSGMSWEDFVKQRILTPIGMERTLTSTLEMKNGMDVSSPHNYKFEKQIPIEWINWDNMSSAGSIISSVSDMKEWLFTQLNSGIHNSDTLWSASRTAEMHSVKTAKGISNWSKKNFPSKTFSGYGLGWDIFNYHGQKVVNHGGGYDGFISKVALVPEENLGIVILTNTNTWITAPLTYQILDEFLSDSKNKKDWSKFYLDIKNQVDESDAADLKKLEESQVLDTKTSLDINEYAGTYNSEMYGDLTLRVIGDQLAFQFEPTPIFRGTIRHWHYDTFRLNWGTQMMLPSGFMTFILNAEGKVAEVKVDVPNPDFDFTELEFKKVE